MSERKRIWLFDNVKAFLMLMVVFGHMLSNYVKISRPIRMSTLWIYTFHMPAFVFVSGVLHKQYAPDAKLRWDKVIGFTLCGLALKYMDYFLRLAMGQHPHFHLIYEAGIPWYLFVMAEYEVFFWLLRKLDGKKVIAFALLISLVSGYFPQVNDNFCIARFINFMPFYAVGYYLQPAAVAEWVQKKQVRIAAWVIMPVTFIAVFFLPWKAYRFRKCFTGRRSYEFLAPLLKPLLGGHLYTFGWALRIATIAFSCVMIVAVLAMLPNRNLGFISKVGSSTLNIYFWHRIVCYGFTGYKLYPTLVSALGAAGGLAVYVAIGVAMTALFTLPVFGHPANDILAWSRGITRKDLLLH